MHRDAHRPDEDDGSDDGTATPPVYDVIARNQKRPVIRHGMAEEWAKQDARRLRRHKVRTALYASYSPFRRKLVQVVESAAFERGVYFILVVNCLLLGIQNIKSLQPYQAASQTLDAVFTVCYVLEMTAKIAAMGIGFQGGYLSRYWNWIDGSITLTSAVSLIAYVSNSSSDTAVLTVVRALQLIRPLRMLTALASLRTLLRALGASVARLGNVAILTAAFLTLMALIALAFFRFIFDNECHSVVALGNLSVPMFVDVALVQSDEAPVCVMSGNTTALLWDDSAAAGYNPVNVSTILSTIANATATVVAVERLQPQYDGLVCPYGSFCVPGVGPDNGMSSFDSIFSSTILLYTILSLEGWSSIMFYVVDALGTWVTVYFVLNVVVGTIFVLNLVLATVSDGFGRSIKYQKRFASQRRVVDDGGGAPSWGGMFIPAALSMMALPEGTLSDRLHKVSEWVRLFVLHNRVYQTMRPVATCACIVVLSTTHAGMSDSHRRVIANTTTAFAIAFALENVLEIVGLRTRILRDPVRIADCIISIGALTEAGMQSAPTVSALRMVRLLEVLMRFPSLRKQIRTLRYAIQDTLPLLLFMGVLLFLAALIGTQLFGGKFCGFDSESPSRVDTSLCDNVPRLNFDNIGYSAVSVFVIFCGDGWRDMMVVGMEATGDYAAIYFCLSYLIGGYLMLNLFVAVMITSADMLEEEAEQTIVRSERVSLFDPTSVVSGVFDSSTRSNRGTRGLHTNTTAGGGDASTYDEDGEDEVELALVRQSSQRSVASAAAQQSNDSFAKMSRQGSSNEYDENDSFILGSGAKSQRAAAAAQQRAAAAAAAAAIPKGKGARRPPSQPSAGADSSPLSPTRGRQRSVHFHEDVDDAPAASSKPAPLPNLDDLLGTPAVQPHTSGSSKGRSHSKPPSDDSDDDDPLKLSVGLLSLVDTFNAAQDHHQQDPSSPLSDSRAERILDDEAQYDLINRHSDLQSVDMLRKVYRDALDKQVASLPWFRRVAGSIVKSRRFEYFFTIIVFYSMATVAVGRATDYPDSNTSQFKDVSDLVVAILFLAEAVLKITHYGPFHRKGALLKGYFNYRWNVFDCIIMVLSLVVACAMFSTHRTFRTVADWFRISRVLRPFSLIGRREGLKVVARASLASLPYIRNVGLLTILVWVSFAIFGTQLFAGRFGACTAHEWGDMSYGALGNLTTRAACLAHNHSWVPPQRNFDDLGASMLTLFQVATVDNWSDIMFMGADSYSTHDAPQQRSRMYLIPFFIGYILLTNFFLIQFFVASMCDVYFTVKAEMEEALRCRLLQSHEVFLDPHQKTYLGMYRRALYFVKPPLHVTTEEGSLRASLRKVVRHRAFEPTLTILAIAHIVIESLVFAEHPPLSLDALLVVDWTFTAVFWCISGVTWVVYGTRNFLESSRGRWSLLINLFTMAGLVLDVTSANAGAASLLRQMRVFRLYRIFYVTQTMQLLVDTLLYSLPSFANVFFLLFLVFYVYAAVGMQLFGRTQQSLTSRTDLNRYASFERFDKALIALLRVATFDDWTELMYSCAIQAPTCDPNIGECPPPSIVAYLYFLSFAVVGQWIGINFFAAEIIDAFTHAEMEERYAIQKEHVARFQRLWKELTGSSEGPMKIAQLAQFLQQLGGPLGPDLDRQQQPSAGAGDAAATLSMAGGSPPAAPTAATATTAAGGAGGVAQQQQERRQRYLDVLRFMRSIDVPLVHNEVLQGSVFDALVRHFYGVPLPLSHEQSLGRVLNSRFQTKQFLRQAAKTQTATELQSLRDAVDFSSPLSSSHRGQSPLNRETNVHPFWIAYHSAQNGPGDAYSSGGETLRMAVAAIMVQSRWRGARIRELVRMVQYKKDHGGLSPTKSFARRKPEPSAALQHDPSMSTSSSLNRTKLGNRGRRSSVATFDQPRKIRSIAERLKSKHSNLI